MRLVTAAALALGLVSVEAWADRTVAVLPLSQGASPAEYDGLGTGLAAMMISDLVTVDGIVIVERERLNDIVAELELSKTEIIDPKTAQRMGRALSADLVLTGVYSVIEGTLRVDVRMFTVEKGATLKASDASGPIGEFVAVEKEVMTELIDGLQVELTMAAQRKLLLESPTEDLEALAAYGRGIEAEDEGNLDAARLAYEAAVREDPGFAEAAAALVAANAKLEAAGALEAGLARSAKEKAYDAALAQLPSELDRPATFKDTAQSTVDLSLRWVLLSQAGQSCQLMGELRHYFERRKGKWQTLGELLPGKTPMADSELANAAYEARGDALLLRGPKSLWAGDPGIFRMLQDRAMRFASTPVQLLVGGNMEAESSDESLAYAVLVCLPPDAREAAWAEVLAQAEKFGILEQPLSYTYSSSGSIPSGVTLGTSMRLYRAWLHATANGPDAQVIAMTDAELSRYPEGAPGRAEVIRRAQDVIAAGEAAERSRVARMGLGPEELVASAKAIRDRARLNLEDPLCAGMADVLASQAASALERIGDRPPDDGKLDQIGMIVAPLAIAGCVAGQTPLPTDKIAELVRIGAGRRHPAKAADAACTTAATALAKLESAPMVLGLQRADQARVAYGWLVELHRLRADRCLLP